MGWLDKYNSSSETKSSFQKGGSVHSKCGGPGQPPCIKREDIPIYTTPIKDKSLPDERYGNLKIKESTKVNKQKHFKEYTEREKEIIKANKRLEKIGEISKHEPQSVISKTKEVLLNPMTAFGYAARNQYLPDHFSKGKRNATDYAIDVINPAQYIEDAKNVIQGTYRGDLLQVGEGLLGTVPMALEAKNIGKALNKTGDAITNSNLLNNKKITSEIDWSKWNEKIPKDKKLIDEYVKIERKAKKDGTWMKNPDGSNFKGDAETFVQMRSKNFKNWLTHGLNKKDAELYYDEFLKDPKILYHQTTTTDKFNAFDATKGARKISGENHPNLIFTSPVKDQARSYGFGHLYSLAGRMHNPKIVNYNGRPWNGSKLLDSGEWQERSRMLTTNNQAQRALKRGYDSFVADNVLDYGVSIGPKAASIPGNTTVFFDSRNLKSIKNNSGSFDINNPDVYNGFDFNFLTRPLTPFTKNELTSGTHLYRKIGGKKGLQDLINKGGAQAPGPMRMNSGQVLDTPFFGVGNKPNENYSGLFAVETAKPSLSKYDWSNRVGGTNNYGVAPINRETGEVMNNIPLEDLEVYRKKWFSNNYKKLDKNNLEEGMRHANLQNALEKTWKWGSRGALLDQLLNDGEYTGGKWLDKYQDGGNIPKRNGVRKNPDGSVSTHLMKAEKINDSTWVGFPSLFQNEDGSWLDMSENSDWWDTYKEAEKRGEVRNFGKDSISAINYGKGSWKNKHNNTDSNTKPNFQRGGKIRDERYEAVKVRDGIPKSYKYEPKPMSESLKQKLAYNAFLEKTGEISKHEPQSVLDKVKEVALNPVTAFGYVARNEPLPDNFSRGKRNATDYAIDVINPVQYIEDAKNVIQGTYKGDIGQVGEGLLGVVPLALEAKNTSKILNNSGEFLTTKTPLKNTYKLNPEAVKSWGNVGETPHWLKGYQEEWNPTTKEQLEGFKDYIQKTQDRLGNHINIKPSENVETLRRNFVKSGSKKSKEALKLDNALGVRNSPIKSYIDSPGQGSFGQIFELRNNPNKVIKTVKFEDPYIRSYDNLIERSNSLRDKMGDRVAFPTKVAGEGDSRLLFMDNLRPKGETIDLSEALKSDKVPKEAIDTLKKDIETLEDNGLYVDLLNSDNIVFDVEKQKFVIFDVSDTGTLSNLSKDKDLINSILPDNYTEFDPKKMYEPLPKELEPELKFNSEIDWSDWNKEIPENKELMDEYLEIEKRTKKDGSWMKNPDGTDFKGTPEQFVQFNSSNFKKAFPEGYNEVYRGVGPANNNPDFSQGYKEGDKAVFTADKNLAKEYEWGVLDAIKKQRDNFLTPTSNRNSSGIYQLAHPKGNQIAYNAMGDDWTNINLSKGASKINLEFQLKKQQDHLRNLLDTGLDQDGIAFAQERINSLQNYIDNFDKMGNNKEAFTKMRQALGDSPSTDEMAAYLENTDLNNITLQNIVDGGLGDVTIVNNKKGKYLKSLRGNNGIFDMNNPNIFKALIPGLVGGAWLNKYSSEEDKKSFNNGGIIEDDRGQWAHPGKVTKINSNNITMKGVNYPVLGISDTGDTKLMMPNQDYKFQGNNVTEYPIKAQNGNTVIDPIEYAKKYPPIYLNDPDDPRIGGYAPEGNEYIYKESKHKRRPKEKGVEPLTAPVRLTNNKISNKDVRLLPDPEVDYYNVTKEVNSSFGSHRKQFRVSNKKELDRLIAQQKADESSTTGKDNRLIVKRKYKPKKHSNGGNVSGGWLDKYNK